MYKTLCVTSNFNVTTTQEAGTNSSHTKEAQLVSVVLTVPLELTFPPHHILSIPDLPCSSTKPLCQSLALKDSFLDTKGHLSILAYRDLNFPKENDADWEMLGSWEGYLTGSWHLVSKR